VLFNKSLCLLAKVNGAFSTGEAEIARLFSQSLYVAFGAETSLRRIDIIQPYVWRFLSCTDMEAITIIVWIVNQSDIGNFLQIGSSRRRNVSEKHRRHDWRKFDPKFGTFQIPVDSLNETSGGA
jgi:hypothetical protein